MSRNVTQRENISTVTRRYIVFRIIKCTSKLTTCSKWQWKTQGFNIMVYNSACVYENFIWLYRWLNYSLSFIIDIIHWVYTLIHIYFCVSAKRGINSKKRRPPIYRDRFSQKLLIQYPFVGIFWLGGAGISVLNGYRKFTENYELLKVMDFL